MIQRRALSYPYLAAFRRAAQRAFIESESFFRPAAVRPLRRLRDFAGLVAPSALRTPAQRALAAAASLALVAADIGRRLPLLPRGAPGDGWVAPPNRELRRASSVCICSRSDKASFSLLSDRSMALNKTQLYKCN